MRDLKFRVWVEAPDGEKAMHYPKLVSFGSAQLSWATLQDDTVIKDNGWYTKREVMQYTGLKDKDGKEIYEGDIVKVYDHTGVVEYDRYAFMLTGFYDTSYDVPADVFSEVLDDCEVIGNIYENPDLLK